MHIKVLGVLLLLGACVAQGASTGLSEADKGIVDDLIQKAKEAIEQLQKYLTGTINDALKYFEELKNQIVEQGDKAIEAVKQQIEKIIAQAQAKIEEIKQQAAQAGVDIGDCLAQNDEKFANLLKSILQNEIQCVQNEIDKALDIVNGAIKIVTDTLKSVQDLPEKLANCKLSIFCIKDVIVEVAKLQSSLPLQIAAKVQEVTEFVTALPTRIEVCAATQLAKAAIDAAGIVAEVAKCAADKMKEH